MDPSFDPANPPDRVLTKEEARKVSRFNMNKRYQENLRRKKAGLEPLPKLKHTRRVQSTRRIFVHSVDKVETPPEDELSSLDLPDVPPNQPIADEEVRRRFCLLIAHSFPEFLKALWEDRQWNRIAPLSDVELDMADWIANGPSDRGVIACRGKGKTHLAVAMGAWRLLRDPQRKIIIVSKTDPEARKTVGLFRGCLGNVWFLNHLSPRGARKMDGGARFNVSLAKIARQPSVSAFGIGGQLEGNRAHTIIADDVETRENTKNQTSRDDLDERVREFKDILYPRPTNDEVGPVDPCEIIYLGTFHHEDSLYNKLVARDYKFRSWPIAYPAPDENVLNLSPLLRGRLERKEVQPGDPTCPLHFDHANIESKKKEGPIRFAMQHMCICDLGKTNRYPLKIARLVVMPVHRDKAPISVMYGQFDGSFSTEIEDIPHDGFAGAKLFRPMKVDETWDNYTGTKAWIDPAGTGEDYTAITVLKQLHGYLWCPCCHGLPGGASMEDMETLVMLCRQWGARDIYIESTADPLNTYRPLFEAVMRRFYLEPHQSEDYPKGWKATLVNDTKITHSTAQKEVRIVEALDPVLGSHRLVISPDAIHQQGLPDEAQLWYQMSRLTKARKCLDEDGKVDSLAGCVRAWSYSLTIDPAKSRARMAEQNFDELLREHRRLAGVGSPEPSWIDRRW